MDTPELHNYKVKTETETFDITAEKVRLHQGNLMFLANDKLLAVFNQWKTVFSTDCFSHVYEDGLTVIKPK